MRGHLMGGVVSKMARGLVMFLCHVTVKARAWLARDGRVIHGRVAGGV